MNEEAIDFISIFGLRPNVFFFNWKNFPFCSSVKKSTPKKSKKSANFLSKKPTKMIRKTLWEGEREEEGGGMEGGREGEKRGVQKSLEHSKLLHEFVRALINHATTHLTAAAAHTQQERKKERKEFLQQHYQRWVMDGSI